MSTKPLRIVSSSPAECYYSQDMASVIAKNMNLLAHESKALNLNLSSQQLNLFGLYQKELLRWNSRFNLTAINEPSEVQRLHFLDSLTVLMALPPHVSSGTRVVDVGTGAGFPGIPLKIICKNMQLTLVESTMKKVAFLKYLIGILGLNDVEIYRGRAEEACHDINLREGFDIVLARGLAPLRTLAELTLPFCKLGGVVIAHKKGDLSLEIARAKGAIDAMGGSIKKIWPIKLNSLSDDRVLLAISKEKATPSQYPRRSGIPSKKPI
jgi:16S rRNA (guanine527-N7)-methyltransferase